MTCKWCGSVLSAIRGSEKQPKFCGDECRKAANRAYARKWHAERPGYHANYLREWRKANPNLNAAHNATRRKPARRARCEECKAEFETARADQRFCSNKCGHRWHRRRSEAKKTPEQRWNDRTRANKQRRRARKKTGVAGDVIRLADLRERDGSRCGICGRRVGAKVWPHPQSASIDHIVPLAQDGLHEWANVQLAHLRCNVRKGARGGGERLRLVG